MIGRTRFPRVISGVAAAALVISAIALPWAISKLCDLRLTQPWRLAHGARTSATVEKIVRVGGEPCAAYDIAFKTEDGRSVQIQRFEVLPGAASQPGDQITVAYDPSRPTVLRSVGQSSGDRYGQWRWWVAIVVAAVAIAVTSTTLLTLSRRRRSLRDDHTESPEA